MFGAPEAILSLVIVLAIGVVAAVVAAKAVASAPDKIVTVGSGRSQPLRSKNSKK